MIKLSIANLYNIFNQADEDDLAEALLAYSRYNKVMRLFSDEYGAPIDRVTSAFCALSPNNDYYGNLRSLASVLKGYRDGTPLRHIKVSTYRHCRNRAFSYVAGDVVFIERAKGLKIRSFYFNVLNPDDPVPVTVDGHIVAAWRGQELIMKEAIVKGVKEYKAMSDGVRELARCEGMIANQAQAAIWFARKRTRRIKYSPQGELFGDPSDKWKTVVTPDEAPPYEPDPSQPPVD